MNDFVGMDVVHSIYKLIHNLISEDSVNRLSFLNIISQTVLTKFHLYIHYWQKSKAIF